MIRCYSDLIQLPTFEERFRYLQLNGAVGKTTFGFDRYINQRFYHSPEWYRVKNQVIARDMGCDLGIEGRDIFDRAYVHHMNPILIKDFVDSSDQLLNPEFLITTTLLTHNAIHYGDDSIITFAPVERKPNDMCPWRK